MTEIDIPTLWIRPTDGRINSQELNAWFQGQGYTVILRERGPEVWRITLQETLSAEDQTTLRTNLQNLLQPQLRSRTR